MPALPGHTSKQGTGNNKKPLDRKTPIQVCKLLVPKRRIRISPILSRAVRRLSGPLCPGLCRRFGGIGRRAHQKPEMDRSARHPGAGAAIRNQGRRRQIRTEAGHQRHPARLVTLRQRGEGSPAVGGVTGFMSIVASLARERPAAQRIGSQRERCVCSETLLNASALSG